MQVAVEVGGFSGCSELYTKQFKPLTESGAFKLNYQLLEV